MSRRVPGRTAVRTHKPCRLSVKLGRLSPKEIPSLSFGHFVEENGCQVKSMGVEQGFW